MKKGIVVVFIVLALIVVVSPGIVGMLAEKSMDEQIDWAELENQDISITAERFDRGWFSSEGRHRIEMNDSGNASGLRDMLGLRADENLPALLVDTKLNHGLIPVSSMGDENGSLSPGLGNAVSTLSVEMPDGEIIELPGTVYSSLSLAGDLSSNYALAAGSSELATWGDTSIHFDSAMSTGAFGYDGRIESLQILAGGDGEMQVSNLSFAGDLTMSPFGYAVGDMNMSLDEIAVDVSGAYSQTIGPMAFETRSSINEGKVDSASELKLTVDSIPNVGQIGLDSSVSVSGVDGAALGRLVRGLQNAPSGTNGAAMMAGVEQEMLDLIAAGGDLHIERLDISLPQGTIKSVMNVKFLESDPTDFIWTSALLSLEADASFEIPEMIVDMAMMMAPQADAIQGFLRKNGDVYEVDAAYKKGLMTVNGVPMALPIQ